MHRLAKLACNTATPLLSGPAVLLQKAPGVSTPEELLHQLTQLQREAASATSALGNRNTEIRELQGVHAPVVWHKAGSMSAHGASVSCTVSNSIFSVLIAQLSDMLQRERLMALRVLRRTCTALEQLPDAFAAGLQAR